MGFKAPQKIATVRGEDDYEGFEAVVSLSLPLSESLAFTDAITSGDGQRVMATMQTFGDEVLISWNLEFTEKSAARWNKSHADAAMAEGSAIPASGEGLLTQDIDFARVLLDAFSEALTAPPLTPSGTPELGATPASESSQQSGADTGS